MAVERAQRTDLSDLVRRRRAELKLSLRAVEARTAPPGGTTPAFRHSFIGRLEEADPTVKPLDYAGLQALARALDLPLRVVQDAAAAQFLGVDRSDEVWSQDGSTRVLVARMEELTPEQRQQLADLADMWATRNRSNPG